jgi:hypothetical protein
VEYSSLEVSPMSLDRLLHWNIAAVGQLKMAAVPTATKLGTDKARLALLELPPPPETASLAEMVVLDWGNLILGGGLG